MGDLYTSSGISGVVQQILGVIPAVLFAIILLVLAFFVAWLAKFLVMKLLKLFKVDKALDKLGIKDEKAGSSLEFVGKLVFVIVFLLFLPGALDQLGIQSVTQPIANMVSQVVNFIPNILAAIVILVFGSYIAKLVRQLLVPVLKRVKVDSLHEKIGLDESKTTISGMLGYVAYVLIMIPIIIAALHVLNIAAISVPAIAMLDSIFAYIPKVFVSVIILIIGVSIAKLIRQLLSKILSGLGLDGLMKKLLPAETKMANFSLSEFVSSLVMYVLVLFFIVEALNVINLAVLTQIGQTIISYLPNIIIAVVIMVAGIILATWAESGLKKKFEGSKVTPIILKTVILVLAVFMTLSQLGIAGSIVTTAFVIVLGALGIAFAVAFGIGGRQFAANMLQWVEDNTIKNKNKK